MEYTQATEVFLVSEGLISNLEFCDPQFRDLDFGYIDSCV